MTQEKFVSAQELPVHWDGIEDKESGVKSLEVSTAGGGGGGGGVVVVAFSSLASNAWRMINH